MFSQRGKCQDLIANETAPSETAAKVQVELQFTSLAQRDLYIIPPPPFCPTVDETAGRADSN